MDGRARGGDAQHDDARRSTARTTTTRVAMRHGEVSRAMFPASTSKRSPTACTPRPGPRRRTPRSSTASSRNGAPTTSELRQAIGIPRTTSRHAPRGKEALLDAVTERRTESPSIPTRFTIGFARRAATYKRADLLFSDLTALRNIARRPGRSRSSTAGKAHPHDESGQGR